MNHIIQAIIPLLPSYAEEGNGASCVNIEALETGLLEISGCGQTQTVRVIVALIQNLFITLCLLDQQELERGAWKFVSHPAQLCALSLLNTLADPRQKLFPPGFWDTAGTGDEEKQQQKKVLQALEDRRQAHHLDGNAPPIRLVYVAWGIIKLEDKILFHQREATEHATEYGLIGGRANMKDLKRVMGEAVSNQDLLEALQAPHSEPMFKALEFALHRECEEEARLVYADDHYTAEPWRNLRPWQKCMGAAPNYALTQYFFRLYQINLTTTGYLALRRRLREKSERFIECSLEEVAQGKTTDGAKKLRIDAIYEDFSDDRQALKTALESVPPSYANRYLFSQENESLVLSIQNGILQGEPGKEKALPIGLSPEQKSLLTGIAAHGKGLAIRPDAAKLLVFHEYGWIEVHDPDTRDRFIQLGDLLRKAGFPYLEVSDQNYFRLSLPPGLIFFDPAIFSYQLREESKNNWLLSLNRESIPTLLGEVLPGSKRAPLPSTLALQLKKAAIANTLTFGEDIHLAKKVRSALQEDYQSLGLRRLLLIKDKHYGIACTFIQSSIA